MSEFDPFALFPQAEAQSLADASARIAPSLSAGFGEAWDQQLRSGFEFNASNAYGTAFDAAVGEHLDDVYRQTGTRIPRYLGMMHSPLAPYDGSGYEADMAKLAGQFPAANLAALSQDDFNARALRRMREAHDSGAAMAAREKTWGGTFGGLLGGLTTAVADPVNVALAPFGAGGGLAAQAAKFALIGGVSQGINEALQAGAREAALPGYMQHEMVQNIGEAIVGGAEAGAGFKALGFGLSRLGRALGFGERTLPTALRDDVNIAASEAQAAAVNPLPDLAGEMAHRDALVRAVGQIARGEAVNAGPEAAAMAQAFHARAAPILDARLRLAGESRLPASVERLSEQQLAEFRAEMIALEGRHAASGARLAAAEAKGADAAAALPERQTALSALQADVKSLAADLEARRASVPPLKIDAATTGRLQAIGGELALPAVTAQRRAVLQGQKATIDAEKATIDASNAPRSPLHASVDQEITGLERALTRKQKDAARAEAKLAADTNKITRQQAAAQLRRQQLDAVTGGQRELVTTDLRRSIQRLAQEGYGLKLPADEAGALGARVLAAGDAQLADALLSVTQELQTRPRGAGETLPRRGVDQAYWRGELTARAEAFAQQAGRRLTGEESRLLAERLTAGTQEDAIHTLAELHQRPLTFFETPEHGLPPGETGAPLPQAAAHDPVPPEMTAAALTDPAAHAALLHDLDHHFEQNPAATVASIARDMDGKETLTRRPLADVLAEIDAQASAAKELEACLTGAGQAAAAEAMP